MRVEAMTPDFRALCAELLQPLAEYDGANPYHEHRALITRARAALAAEPEGEGEGPTDEELLESAAKALGYKSIPIDHEGGAVEAYSSELLAFARAVLARWGRPAAPPAPVATDEQIREYAGERFPMCLRNAYSLGRQHGAAQPPAAQPVPPVAPAGGLVERVVRVIADPDGPAELWYDDARAAIREVAAWMRENETGFNAALWLEHEANR